MQQVHPCTVDGQAVCLQRIHLRRGGGEEEVAGVALLDLRQQRAGGIGVGTDGDVGLRLIVQLDDLLKRIVERRCDKDLNLRCLQRFALVCGIRCSVVCRRFRLVRVVLLRHVRVLLGIVCAAAGGHGSRHGHGQTQKYKSLFPVHWNPSTFIFLLFCLFLFCFINYRRRIPNFQPVFLRFITKDSGQVIAATLQ